MYTPNTKWTWTFFLIAVVQAIICLGFETYVFGRFQVNLNDAVRGTGDNAPVGSEGSRTIPTYLAVFIFGFLYELVLVWDALRLKNTIQVIGICLYNLGMLIYASVEVEQVHDAISSLLLGRFIDEGTWPQVRPFLIAAPIIIAIGTVSLSLVAWKLYTEFAWTIYKHISADLKMKRRYLTYQIYVALLKFDFFFFIGFTVQFLVVVASGSNLPRSEFGLTIAAIPVVVVLLFLAAFFTRREILVGQIVIIMVYFAAMAYFIFKIVRMTASDQKIYYRPVLNSLLTFATLTLIMLILTIVAAFMTMMNFNKGLKPHIQNQKGVVVADEMKYGDPYVGGQAHQLGPVQQRMTID